MSQRGGVSTGEQSRPGQDLESDRVGSRQRSRVEEARGGGSRERVAGAVSTGAVRQSDGEGRPCGALLAFSGWKGRPGEASQRRGTESDRGTSEVSRDAALRVGWRGSAGRVNELARGGPCL